MAPATSDPRLFRVRKFSSSFAFRGHSRSAAVGCDDPPVVLSEMKIGGDRLRKVSAFSFQPTQQIAQKNDYFLCRQSRASMRHNQTFPCCNSSYLSLPRVSLSVSFSMMNLNLFHRAFSVSGYMERDTEYSAPDQVSSQEPESAARIQGEDTGEQSFDWKYSKTDILASRAKRKATMYSLVDVLMNAPSHGVVGAIERWIAEGNEAEQSNIFVALFTLRRRKLFRKALEFSEWLNQKGHLELDERTCACRVDLIAKVHGLEIAEKYIEDIPETFRTGIVYRTLLANFVACGAVPKAEQLIQKMRELGFPITVFDCNQLLLLYLRYDLRKIPEALLVMEKENIQPSRFTYELLLDAKGLAGDISGMEEIIKRLKSIDEKLGSPLLATIAKHYLSAGFRTEAEATLKEIEGDDSDIGVLTLDVLVRLHVEMGALEKADLSVQNFLRNQWRPLYRTLLFLMDSYARTADISNAEKVKKWLSECGYAGRPHFQLSSHMNPYDRRMTEYGFRDANHTVDKPGISKATQFAPGFSERRLDNNTFTGGNDYPGSYRDRRTRDSTLPTSDCYSQDDMDDAFDNAPIFNLARLKR